MERMTKFRVTLFLLFFMAILGFFSVRLFASQVVNADENSNNKSTYTTMTRVKAARGDILDRNGTVLAKSDKVYHLILDSRLIVNNEECLPIIMFHKILNIFQEHYTWTFYINKTRDFEE